MAEENGAAFVVLVAMAGALVTVALVTRFGSRLPASFGEGFLPFRRDGWPRGVQEDDDARWTWGRQGSGGRDASPREPRITRPWLSGGRPVPPTSPQRH